MTKIVTKKSTSKEKSTFGKDRRRKHHHWLVTVYLRGRREVRPGVYRQGQGHAFCGAAAAVAGGEVGARQPGFVARLRLFDDDHEIVADGNRFQLFGF